MASDNMRGVPLSEALKKRKLEVKILFNRKPSKRKELRGMPAQFLFLSIFAKLWYNSLSWNMGVRKINLAEAALKFEVLKIHKIGNSYRNI